jgi:peptidoglycan/xylan/chitin deacetylase (PgdA/CDA1 family)
MEYLKRKGYKVLPLSVAIENLRAGKSSIKNIAITIDDGFYSVLKCAAPVLLKYAFPATLYVTTYYVKHSHPVFCLAVQYMFWKTERDHFDAAGFLGNGGVQGLTPVNDDICWKIIEFGEVFLPEAGRIDLLEKLGTALQVPLDALMRSRALSLLTPDEIRALSHYGIDIQLHTHRHRFPADNDKLAREIIENREFLSRWYNQPLVDLCYPSGEWREEQWPVLTACHIRTATTCEIGLNDKGTSAYALRRFLDGENISDLEFEAELTGFKQLLRDVRSMLFS